MKAKPRRSWNREWTYDYWYRGHPRPIGANRRSIVKQWDRLTIKAAERLTQRQP